MLRPGKMLFRSFCFVKALVFGSLLLCRSQGVWSRVNGDLQMPMFTQDLPRISLKDAGEAMPSRAVGKLPALGWNTWNAYRCDISEDKVIAAAKQFIALGLKEAGYQYINIDDCWSQRERNSSGHIVPDYEKFPEGIAGVAKKVHDLGLKIGIYSDAGLQTCAKYPGSLGHEELDAETFAAWGIDYLKYDNCNVPDEWTDIGTPPHNDWFESNSAIRFRRMGEALKEQAHPIEYSLCIWGRANVWLWGPRVGHSWRIFDDSLPTWFFLTTAILANTEILDYVDFYSHNDMDMMEIGNGELSIYEQRTHFAVWAFMKSPILLGTDLDNLSKEQIEIITNRELLAFHQDEEFGAPAKPFHNIGGETKYPREYYAGSSSKGIHVFVVNTNAPQNKTIDFRSVPGLSGDKFLVHDMWTSEDWGVYEHNLTVYLENHDTAALLIVPA